jgi:hypothetical protein
MHCFVPNLTFGLGPIRTIRIMETNMQKTMENNKAAELFLFIAY